MCKRTVFCRDSASDKRVVLDSASGSESLMSCDSGALETISEHRFQIAVGDESDSVRHLMCCGALLSGRLTRLILLSVAVSHGSTVLLRTTVGGERGEKGDAVFGSSTLGIVDVELRFASAKFLKRASVLTVCPSGAVYVMSVRVGV